MDMDMDGYYWVLMALGDLVEIIYIFLGGDELDGYGMLDGEEEEEKFLERVGTTKLSE